MYTIKMIKGSTETIIYNDATPDLTTVKLINPKLDLRNNAAGSLTFKMPQGNNGYDTIEPMVDTFEVYRDGDWLWTGRALTIEKDFWLQKTVTCEGALAFLNDTIAPLHKYSTYTIEAYINTLLNIHNTKVALNRRIMMGAISTTTTSGAAIEVKDYVTEDDKVLKYIGDAADNWGLHIRLRKVSDTLYLDMLTDAQLNMATQRIDFGKNLLDYSDNYDWTNIITVLHPIGAKLDTNDTTGDEDYPDHVVINGTPSSSEFTRSGEFLINTAAVNQYGRIEETVNWSEVEDSALLLSLAELYLSDYQYNDLELQVKVLDLKYLLGSGERAFNFLDQVNCYSKPHALDTTFIISEMQIPFDQPENTTFSFKRSTQGTYGADGSSKSGTSVSSGKISAASSEIVTKDSVLKTARENAGAMIDMATNGFITLVPTDKGDRTSAILITNTEDPEQATRKWTWNVNGLAHQTRNSSSAVWSSPNVAITMDGAIVADRITTGTLVVSDTNNRTLFSASMSSHTVTIASFVVKDTKLYSNKSSLDSNTSGVYVGTDGISVGSGSMFTALGDGYLYGGKNGENGYVGFNNYNSDTHVYGTRVCGRGCVAIGTDGFFGVGSYVGINSDMTVWGGVTRSITFSPNKSFTLDFKYGLMCTELS